MKKGSDEDNFEKPARSLPKSAGGPNHDGLQRVIHTAGRVVIPGTSNRLQQGSALHAARPIPYGVVAAAPTT